LAKVQQECNAALIFIADSTRIELQYVHNGFSRVQRCQRKVRIDHL
jgi:hypothetical protein